MRSQLITADSSVGYDIQEVGPIIAALAFVMVIGSVAMASIAICGWRGAKSVALDWLHMKATFYCR